jgi:hypothetical protein
LSGPEVAAEVGAAVDRTNDAIDRDLSEAQVRPPRQDEPAVDLIERNEFHGRIRVVGLSG